MITVMMDGLDQITAFGAVATCINNVGPGLGEVASNFVNVPPMSKIVLAFAMLLGRLEIFTFLVLLSPTFWRR
jgi:trk system potassium uptake protein TrkH